MPHDKKSEVKKDPKTVLVVFEKSVVKTNYMRHREMENPSKTIMGG